MIIYIVEDLDGLSTLECNSNYYTTNWAKQQLLCQETVGTQIQPYELIL